MYATTNKHVFRYLVTLQVNPYVPKSRVLLLFQTPVDVIKNVKSLVEYLVHPCKSDVEKIRAFYYWICNNIG